MQDIILFILTFLFTFIIYQLFIVRKAKSKKKKKNKWEVIEISYLVKKYKLDMEKISYNQLLQIVALTSSFDIALIVTIILMFDNFILEIIVGFIAMFLIIMISYHLIYIFYKRKGMILDEKCKRY